MHKKLTILQVLPALDSGGVEIGTLSLARALIKAGHTALIASAGGQMVKDLKAIDAQHFTLPLNSKNPFTIFRNIKKLRQIITRHNVEIVHARSRAPAWSSFFACKKENCAFVTTVHGAYKVKSKLKKYYNSIMLRSDCIIAISEFIKGYIKETYSSLKGVNLQQIEVIHRGVDSEIFNPDAISPTRTQALTLQWNLPPNTPLILLPARLSPTKGHSVLLKALAKLTHINFLCLLVGSDQGRHHYSAFIKKQITDLNLQHKVRIVDYCSDMAAAYKLANLVINPSTVPEAFGRVIVEAQAMRTPIIATALGAPLDLITHGKTGWLFPSHDVTRLATTIQEVLGLDNTTLEKIGYEARDYVEKNYSNAVMCQKTLNLYYKTIERKKA